MAVTPNRAGVVTLDTALDEIPSNFKAARIRWVSAGAVAGDVLTIAESASVPGGGVTNIVWRSVASGPNYVEESMQGFTFRFGMHIVAIGSGTLDVYFQNE